MQNKVNLPDDPFFDGLREEPAQPAQQHVNQPLKSELDNVFAKAPGQVQQQAAKAGYPAMPQGKPAPVDVSSFLPPDYEPPASDVRYMKLEDGDNRIRIVSQPIIGYENWYEETPGNSKPVRWRMNDTEKPKKYTFKEKTRHFWAMIVWNFKRGRLEVLQITQASIRDGIIALTKNPEWGAPYFYDITITKSGQKLDTEYAVMGMPRSTINIVEVYQELYKSPILLEKLYENGDPFDLTDEEADFARTKIGELYQHVKRGQQ